jgi:MtN3 and saliva related transmembrane protein
MDSWLPNTLGIVAGVLSTSSFVPQVLKAWREGDTDAISKRMYMVTVTAFTLWTCYGFVLGSPVLIVLQRAQSGAERRNPVAQDPQRPRPRGLVREPPGLCSG